MDNKKTNKVPTYSQQAKKNKLEITPRHLNIDENSVYEFQRTAELDEIFCNYASELFLFFSIRSTASTASAQTLSTPY